MSDPSFPEDFLQLLQQIKGKRPRIVAQHILQHGLVTTEELETLYGYKHPPRAARDLRELGIPLVTIRVKHSDGRSIAAYHFGDPNQVIKGRLAGRRVLSKRFKKSLIANSSNRCNSCQTVYDERYLQVDHRIPYEIAGDDTAAEPNPEDYMLLCGACNRAKSWSCEHCPNWQEDKIATVCLQCYWAKPENYKHIAVRQIRRVEIVWANEEIELYDKLQAKAEQMNITFPEYVKARLNELNDDDVTDIPKRS